MMTLDDIKKLIENDEIWWHVPKNYPIKLVIK